MAQIFCRYFGTKGTWINDVTKKGLGGSDRKITICDEGDGGQKMASLSICCGSEKKQNLFFENSASWKFYVLEIESMT